MNEEFSDVMEKADKCLMVPDVLNYFLTGKMVNEPSELSTTQLMDVKEKKISSEICEKFKISEKLFSELGVHGTKIGDIKKKRFSENLELIMRFQSYVFRLMIQHLPLPQFQHRKKGFWICKLWNMVVDRNGTG